MPLPALPSRVPKRFIHPGEHLVTRDRIMISTLLGSCVAVCLYDPVERVMGMNHFLLPTRNPLARDPLLASDAGRYGLWAMEILINGVLGLGAQRKNLRAKAFGGGNVLDTASGKPSEHFSIGVANVEFVRCFLRQDKIPLVAEDLGGNHGRQIHFSGGDFSVYLRRIPRRQEQVVVAEEKAYLESALKRRKEPSQPEFF